MCSICITNLFIDLNFTFNLFYQLLHEFKCPKPIFEVWAGNYSYSFDVEDLKFLVVIGHSITYIGM